MILTGARCPACGHEALMARPGVLDADLGNLTCDAVGCPAPDAAQRILADAVPHHVAEVGADDFSLQHPLMERLDGVLLDTCPLGRWMNALTGPPVAPGRYNVIDQPETYVGLRWRFERTAA